MNKQAVKSETVQERSYEELCDHSRQLVGEIDERRWLVGDDACEVETHYGEHTLQSFARDIGMNKSTLAGWKRVAEFYPDFIRRKLLEAFPNLTYTYYKDALRWEDVDQAVKWLEEVSGEGWSADQAAHELTERLGGSPNQSISIPARFEKGYRRDGLYILEVSVSLDDMEFVKKARHLAIRVRD